MGKKQSKPIRYSASEGPADAAAEFAKRFNDPSQWKVKAGVPIFDEHEEQMSVMVPGPDGKPVKQQQTERFTAAELQKYAANCNALVASGNPPGLSFGHTLDKGRESDQPETLGYGKNYRVQFSPTLGRHVIVHDEYYFPDKYEAAKTCPHRSVERWREDQVFKPIALLRREPKRRLGPVIYHADSQKTCIRYSLEAAMFDGQPIRYEDDGPPKKPEDAAPEAPAEPAADPLASDPPAPPAPPAPAPPAAPPAAPVAQGMMPSPQDEELFKQLCQKYGLKYADPATAMPAPMPGAAPPMPGAAAPPVQMAAMPSATNTAPPAMGKPPMQMQADTATVARYEAELKAVKDRCAVLEQGERIARYSAILESMENEGWPIEAAEELERCQDYSQEQFDQHCADVKKYGARQQRPTGPAIRIADSTSPELNGGHAGPMNEEQYKLALEQVREHNKTWPEAMKYAMENSGRKPVRGVAS